MASRVIATFEVEGFHCWPAAWEEVSFLRDRHRHQFSIRIEAPVEHGDREVEFILLGRQVKTAMAERFGTPCEFGTLSCEQIAVWVLSRFAVIQAAEVWEDKENGARVER